MLYNCVEAEVTAHATLRSQLSSGCDDDDLS